MPEIDTAFLTSICGKLAQDMNYRPEKPITDNNSTYCALQKEFAQYSPAQWFHNACLLAATMAELPYPDHSEEVRYQIAKYTWLVLYVDDVEYNQAPERLESFQRSIIDVTAEPESEFLRTFRKHLAEFYRLFEPSAANGISLCGMEFIQGSFLEQMPKIQSMKLTTASTSWPKFLRRKTGSSIAYAYMLFPKEVNVDITVYIQVIDDMTFFIDLLNDILSFYKEKLAGERPHYAYNRAAVTQRTIEDTLSDMVEDAIQADSRVTQVLESSGNTSAVDIWRKFVNGYFGFHFTLKRYRLHDLGHGGREAAYKKQLEVETDVVDEWDDMVEDDGAATLQGVRHEVIG
ncbi:terpenoid synthase [Agrocybe pediades]|nr:terpenoid synthase [Agrocybe pediades]